jgi:hypothetical protein
LIIKSQLLRDHRIRQPYQGKRNEDKKLIFQKIWSSACDKTTYKKQAFVKKTT